MASYRGEKERKDKKGYRIGEWEIFLVSYLSLLTFPESNIMIYTITLNPAWDLTYLTPTLAPGLNRAYSCAGKAGGKGINVSRAIHACGGRCLTLAVLAGETGQTIAGALASEGISPVIFAGDGNTRTNISAIADTGESMEINGPGATMSEECFQAMLSYLRDKLKDGDILCLCGSTPPFTGVKTGAGEGLYTRLCTMAEAAGAKVVLDCSGAALADALAGEAPPAVIKPNAAELTELYERRCGKAPAWKRETGADTAVLRDMAAAVVDLNRTAVLCTLGSRGALWIDGDGCVFVPAVKVEMPRAEKGAGDTYLGTFIWHRYGCHADTAAAMEAAAAAAAALVEGK